MHEFKEFVHNSSKKSPVGPKETRILTHDIHDVGSNNRLIVFASLLLAKTQ